MGIHMRKPVPPLRPLCLVPPTWEEYRQFTHLTSKNLCDFMLYCYVRSCLAIDARDRYTYRMYRARFFALKDTLEDLASGEIEDKSTRILHTPPDTSDGPVLRCSALPFAMSLKCFLFEFWGEIDTKYASALRRHGFRFGWVPCSGIISYIDPAPPRIGWYRTGDFDDWVHLCLRRKLPFHYRDQSTWTYLETRLNGHYRCAVRNLFAGKQRLAMRGQKRASDPN